MLDAVNIVFFIKVKDDLAVGLGSESMPEVEQPFAKRPIVVDFAVECDPHGFVFIRNRLPTCMQINDTEPPVAKTCNAVDIHALTVGAAMGEGVHHGTDIPRSHAFKADFSADAAHKVWYKPGPIAAEFSNRAGANRLSFSALNLRMLDDERSQSEIIKMPNLKCPQSVCWRTHNRLFVDIKARIYDTRVTG